MSGGLVRARKGHGSGPLCQVMGQMRVPPCRQGLVGLDSAMGAVVGASRTSYQLVQVWGRWRGLS